VSLIKPWLSGWLAVTLRGVERHSLPAVLLLFGVAVLFAHWYYGRRLYGLAALSGKARDEIVAPPRWGALPRRAVPLPVRQLPERMVPANFGEWLIPHLLLKGLTLQELARQLDRPAADLHAILYGTPAGTHLPSPALVDAICDHLRLDRREGRAVFLAVLKDTLPGGRSISG
jgi:hypothetical protein